MSGTTRGLWCAMVTIYVSGNVMFKYKKDHPLDMKMIDFAMSTTLPLY